MPETEKNMPFRPDPVVKGFLEKHRRLSAVDVVRPWQALKIVALVAGALFFFGWDYKIFWATLLFVLSAFYLVTIAYRLLMVLVSLIYNPEIKISAEECAALKDEDLPIYTILLPMYREGAVAEKLMRAITNLDYPHYKLDVKLLLEEDDELTVSLCREMDLPGCCEVIVCPNSFPKTKPKACNHGLERAQGEYLVIYDAEDNPEPDQLRKAVAAFKKAPEKVICMQGKLNYFNPRENWLTRFFALEYTAWFDLFLPGLHALDRPIPLGGTSNHFRTDKLKELGGWDPFNVTEDCDLGIRIHRHGFRTQVLDSTTWEEANSRVGNWLRQRSRWIKGYFQTHLVHSRCTLRTLWELGPLGYLSFILTVGGMSAMLVLNPVFWLVLLCYGGLWGAYALGADVHPWPLIYTDYVSDIDRTFTVWSKLSWVFCGVAVALFLANFIFILINVIACFRRNLKGLVPWALLTPLYWILISIAAWKGFLQLFLRPFYWEKTTHGLTAFKKAEAEKQNSE